MKKIIKRTVSVLICLLLILVITAFSALILNKKKTDKINNDFTALFDESKYSTPVSVDGVEVIKQDVSCGYAVIEMFSSWNGSDITEKTLYDEYGKVVTSTGKNFCAEMNKRFPQYTTSMHKYLTNTELIDMVYESLKNDVPVPFEWAALCGDEWTLHYSLITGIDVQGNKVTVANPYGYYENISLDEFLSRTRFDAYENMPLFLKFGFAFGIFEKNTVFIAE